MWNDYKLLVSWRILQSFFNWGFLFAIFCYNIKSLQLCSSFIFILLSLTTGLKLFFQLNWDLPPLSCLVSLTSFFYGLLGLTIVVLKKIRWVCIQLTSSLTIYQILASKQPHSKMLCSLFCSNPPLLLCFKKMIV